MKKKKSEDLPRIEVLEVAKLEFLPEPPMSVTLIRTSVSLFGLSLSSNLWTLCPRGFMNIDLIGAGSAVVASGVTVRNR